MAKQAMEPPKRSGGCGVIGLVMATAATGGVRRSRKKFGKNGFFMEKETIKAIFL
jgi:hypothetical protein